MSPVSTQRRRRAPRANLACVSPLTRPCAPGRSDAVLSRRREPSELPGTGNAQEDFSYAGGISGTVLDVGLGAIAAFGGFGSPFAVRGLIFDHLGASGG